MREEKEVHVQLVDVMPSSASKDDYRLMGEELLLAPEFKGKVERSIWDGKITSVITTKTKLQKFVNEHMDGLEERAKKRQEEEEKKVEEEEKRRAAEEVEEQAHNRELSTILITSGYNFEGYKITKYSGYISGDDATQIDRDDLYVDCGQNLTDALVKIRRQSLKELKEAAYALGCNAVIAVDFDYITFEPETANYTGGTTYLPEVIAVTANGTAVVIEKE